jgi:hypothetical protein
MAPVEIVADLIVADVSTTYTLLGMFDSWSGDSA